MTMKLLRDEEVTRWTTDQAQSKVSFQVRHLMVSHVRGEFSQFDANVLTNGTNFTTADVTFKIESKSIHTGDERRDSDLRGREFLRADEHKQIIFRSTSVSHSASGHKMELCGDLQVAGIVRSVNLDMQMGPVVINSWGEETVCLTITSKITREDWGLRWSAAMASAGFLIGDEVIFSCKLELVSRRQHDAQLQQDPVPLMRVETF